MDTSPEGFDLAALLEPIAGDNPAGPDLREDYTPQSLYFRLRDARAEARAAERVADAAEGGADTGEPPQWRSIRQLAPQGLALSKDLEIAAWYTEALIRSDGLVGLTAGVRLMGGLVDTFWEQLYPLPDEDGIATRVAPVTGLNGEGGDGTLSQPLRKLPLYPRPDGSIVAFWEYERSAELLTVDATRRAQRLAAGVRPFEDVENEARAAGGARFAALRRATLAALAAWQALSDSLDAKAGADGPPTSRVRDMLLQLAEVCGKYAPPEAADGDAAAAESAAGMAAADGAGGEVAVLGAAAGAPAGPGRLATREDALRLLGQVAEFFRRTEPHSPLAYTLEDAVRRGRLSLPELLEEVLPDKLARDGMLMSLGIRPAPEPLE
ncbi:MAG: type VI secretion system protein TssA [Acidisphaera sp.]|nr:type VI secretion system protein TssA [Acidisphaera sp.]